MDVLKGLTLIARGQSLKGVHGCRAKPHLRLSFGFIAFMMPLILDNMQDANLSDQGFCWFERLVTTEYSY